MLNPKTINNSVWNRLTKIYNQNKFSGAYLFIGSKGLGKLSFAFGLMGLDENLKNKSKLIKTGAHPDVVLIKPEIEEKKGKKREKQISVDQIQDGLRMFSYSSQEAQNKFLIIDSADKLTSSAGNCLLKTIEELSDNSIVILTASEEGTVLDTIKSRCQKIYFNLKTDKELENLIKKQQPTINQKDLENLINLSRGRIKEAEKFLNNKGYFKNNLDKLNNFREALRGDLKIGFQIANNESKDKQQLNQNIVDWVYYLESFLKQTISEDRDVRIQKKVFEILKELNQARNILKTNPNANSRLLLENFFVQIK
jgi:DNA polymerase-3 subunit delta'